MGHRPHSLSSNRRQALINRYQAGDKIEVICLEFGVARGYPSTLAKRRGIALRRQKEFTTHGAVLNRLVSASLIGSAPL